MKATQGLYHPEGGTTEGSRAYDSSLRSERQKRKKRTTQRWFLSNHHL